MSQFLVPRGRVVKWRYNPPAKPPVRYKRKWKNKEGRQYTLFVWCGRGYWSFVFKWKPFTFQGRTLFESKHFGTIELRRLPL